MVEIFYRQMPAPRDLPQNIPAPRAKIRMQKPQSGGKFSVQIPGGARGGWLRQKLITALLAHIEKKIARGISLRHRTNPRNKIRSRVWSVKVGSHDPIFGANYYSNSKKLMMRINISIRQLWAETKPKE